MTAARPTVVGLGLCVVDHLYVVDELAGTNERARYTRAAGADGRDDVERARAGRAPGLPRRADLTGRRRPRRALCATPSARDGRLDARTRAVGRVPNHDRGRDDPRARRRAPLRHRAPRAIRAARAQISTSRRSGAGACCSSTATSRPRRCARFGARASRASRSSRISAIRARTTSACSRGWTMRSVPEAFVRAWSPGDPADALRRLHREFGGSPVVTLGARGGIYWDAGRVRRFRSPRVRVLDTTGAGDVFHGAFAAGLAHGLALPEIVARAARAGAIACTALGATARLASRGASGRGSYPRVADPETRATLPRSRGRARFGQVTELDSNRVHPRPTSSGRYLHDRNASEGRPLPVARLLQ